MTLNLPLFVVSIAAVYLAKQGVLLSSIWLILNVIETFKALRIVRQNGRRVGIVTRRKAMRDCMIDWIVMMSVNQLSYLPDTLLGWLPLYNSLKLIVMITFLFSRQPASFAIFSSIIKPTIRKYQSQIDLTFSLLESVGALVGHLMIDIPIAVIKGVTMTILPVALLRILGISRSSSSPDEPMSNDTAQNKVITDVDSLETPPLRNEIERVGSVSSTGKEGTHLALSETTGPQQAGSLVSATSRGAQMERPVSRNTLAVGIDPELESKPGHGRLYPTIPTIKNSLPNSDKSSRPPPPASRGVPSSSTSRSMASRHAQHVKIKVNPTNLENIIPKSTTMPSGFAKSKINLARDSKISKPAESKARISPMKRKRVVDDEEYIQPLTKTTTQVKVSTTSASVPKRIIPRSNTVNIKSAGEQVMPKGEGVRATRIISGSGQTVKKSRTMVFRDEVIQPNRVKSSYAKPHEESESIEGSRPGKRG